MEEPRKEEITEEVKKEEEQPVGLPMRSCILMTLAGIYLTYTGYRLCRNVLDGVEGGSWGFMAAGVIFVVIGIGMLVVGGKGLMRNEKEKKEAEAAQKAGVSEKAIPEASEVKTSEPAKKMSIADRANLVNKVNEEESEEKKSDDAISEEKQD